MAEPLTLEDAQEFIALAPWRAVKAIAVGPARLAATVDSAKPAGRAVRRVRGSRGSVWGIGCVFSARVQI
jgi:hypothetical protein